MALVDHESEEYVVLLSLPEQEVTILRAENILESEMVSYCTVESEETLNAVFEVFRRKMEEAMAAEQDSPAEA